ncbi:antibiotic biosynthesis monooxygenase [Mycolicibacterium sp. P9-64]|uniref:antibiotic biosynthesis monooxygenase n=1 Tax=Mycolicibacterium sp. P9-64 TaxID=2024612 RepID=UPI0011EE299F|nr:antibiotic biosynthesis monooxygenase [Mycolicibacterium sp. P9-64]KAA0081150.1 antibiotic biosynthesis monooxygenase [Mycolicibacterium sp. P9-64]
MTTIEEHSPHVTMINVFTVEPEHAAELAALLSDATDKVIRHAPGFVSANIHVSTDGTRVVNYGQWENAAAMDAMRADPAAREHMSKAANLASGFDPHLYTVESVHER